MSGGQAPGVLYVVSTPIGNLGDMTHRAVDTLRAADVILAEDTRHTRRLLDHYGIATPMEDMVELFVAAPDDTIWAVCSGGRLLTATPGEWRWQSALPEGAGIQAESVSFVVT